MPPNIHHVPGRLRVRSPALKASQVRAETLRVQCVALPGVQSTRVNPRTGSLTVLYDPRLTDPDYLWKTVHEAATGQELGHTCPVRRAARTTRAGELFGKAVFDVFLAKTVERTVIALLMTVR